MAGHSCVRPGGGAAWHRVDLRAQAKGRVERANQTLQDRLVKELRLAGINDLGAAAPLLPGFMFRYNVRFAVVPAAAEDAHLDAVIAGRTGSPGGARAPGCGRPARTRHRPCQRGRTSLLGVDMSVDPAAKSSQVPTRT